MTTGRILAFPAPDAEPVKKPWLGALVAAVLFGIAAGLALACAVAIVAGHQALAQASRQEAIAAARIDGFRAGMQAAQEAGCRPSLGYPVALRP